MREFKAGERDDPPRDNKGKEIKNKPPSQNMKSSNQTGYLSVLV